MKKMQKHGLPFFPEIPASELWNNNWKLMKGNDTKYFSKYDGKMKGIEVANYKTVHHGVRVPP